MSIKNVNYYKYKTFHDNFGKLHEEYSHEKADSEASTKLKEVKGKPDKINELLLKRKAYLKEKETKGLRGWACSWLSNQKSLQAPLPQRQHSVPPM